MRRKRSRSAEEGDETPGGDSFLDIVANIVGILVLLVVVVGVRAGREVMHEAEAPPVDLVELQEARDKARVAAYQQASQTKRYEQQWQFSRAEASLREETRMELATYITTLRRELDEERAKLSETDRRSYDTGKALAQARLELEALTRNQMSLIANDSGLDTETVAVDTTPIVRERVKEEVLFRVEAGQIIYLPIQELKEEFQRQAPAMRDALATQTGNDVMLERRIGPIDGFRLRCVLRRRVVSTPQGMHVQGGLVVARLEEASRLRPETIDQAMTDGSEVASRLATVNPKTTVVTLIAYPDSFAILPTLEKQLRERGYRVAKELQREGHPIDFSPGGRETTLQ